MSAHVTQARVWLAAACASLALALSLFGSTADGQGRVRASSVVTPVAACPASLQANGHDYHGLTLSLCSFVGQDLTNANFNGAQLLGVMFIKTNLTGADFSNATFVDTANAALPTDFTMANLTNAKFIGARFPGLTYFTRATLSCADFSNTDFSAPKARFGPSPLQFDRTSACRPKFVASTMNCEFVADWNALDLTSAVVSACANQFRGHDFSGAMLANVVFDGNDLTDTRWAGADLTGTHFQSAVLDGATGLAGTPTTPSRLTGATFNNASVQGVDLSNAWLYGSDFTNANLTNTNLQGSFFTSDLSKNIQTAAKFNGAHMRDVNLSGAKLAGATFDGASFYGSFGGATPSFPCQTNVKACSGSSTGATCSCASAVGTDLTNTDFSNAFLYGVDFGDTSTVINGTKFTGAVLVAANFAGANFKVANGGVPPDFSNAMLMGTNLGSKSALTNTSLAGAYVDFGAATNPSTGNLVQLLLPAKYTRFRGYWNAHASAVCVQVAYGSSADAANSNATPPGFTIAPTSIPSMTCPNGLHGLAGCGAGDKTNSNWNNGLPLSGATPPGSYFFDSTYEAANQTGSCNAGTVDPNW